MINELEQPRSLSKFELFRLYYGEKAKKKGVNQFFRSQIYSCPELMGKLHRAGFRKNSHILPENQVALIFDHLTPPLKTIKP